MKQDVLRSIKMNIRKIKIANLKPAEYNPRIDLKPENVEYQRIKRSLVEFGYVAPIIVNTDMTVDERIADGVYFAKSVTLLKKLLSEPELLDQPIQTPVEF